MRTRVTRFAASNTVLAVSPSADRKFLLYFPTQERTPYEVALVCQYWILFFVCWQSYSFTVYWFQIHLDLLRKQLHIISLLAALPCPPCGIPKQSERQSITVFKCFMENKLKKKNNIRHEEVSCVDNTQSFTCFRFEQYALWNAISIPPGG